MDFEIYIILIKKTKEQILKKCKKNWERKL